MCLATGLKVLVAAVLAVAPAGALGAAEAPHPAPAPPAVGHSDEPGLAFRRAARRLTACLDAEAARAAGERLDPLRFADRAWRACAPSMDAFATAAGGPRARIRGVLRAAVTDAVIAYEARAAFGPRRSRGAP